MIDFAYIVDALGNLVQSYCDFVYKKKIFKKKPKYGSKSHRFFFLLK